MNYLRFKPILITIISLVIAFTIYMDPLMVRKIRFEQKQITEMIPGENTPINITLVMAYYNLGNITKWYGNKTRTKNHYFEWMEFYQWVRNPMVVYSDDVEFLNKMRNLRQNMSERTEYFLLQPGEPRWALSLLPAIEEIFSDPNYPKFSPETVVPKYSCIMHAKYELLTQTIQRNPFLTPYFAWCDAGLYRLVKTTGKYYYVTLPPKFDDTRVAYSQVNPLNEWYSQMDIIKKPWVWLAGGFFVGRGHILIQLAEQYKYFTEMFIQNKTMGSDEQVLYMMYLHNNRPKTTVGLQLYWSNYLCDVSFHLALLSIRHLCEFKTFILMGKTIFPTTKPQYYLNATS